MKNLFLFTGEETYLIRNRIQSWKKEFAKKHNDLNVSFLDIENDSIGKMATECKSAPFLSEKRLIFINNIPPTSTQSKKFNEKKESLNILNELIENPPETSVIVFVSPKPDKRTSIYKKIEKLGEVKNFLPLSENKLQQWITARVSELQGHISSSNAAYLIELCGRNLWKLDQEIQKLVNFSPERKISKENMDKIVIPHFESNIFNLTDAIGTKNHKAALNSLQKLILTGESLTHIFYLIVRQFRLIVQIKNALENQNKSQKEAAIQCKLHPFVVKNVSRQTSRFKWDELKYSYNKLLDIDRDLKTGKIETTVNNQNSLLQTIEHFIIKTCQAV